MHSDRAGAFERQRDEQEPLATRGVPFRWYRYSREALHATFDLSCEYNWGLTYTNNTQRLEAADDSRLVLNYGCGFDRVAIPAWSGKSARILGDRRQPAQLFLQSRPRQRAGDQPSQCADHLRGL